MRDFIREGLEREEKAFHIVDSNQRENHRVRLEREGIDVRQKEVTGQLRVASWDEAYLKDGYFDQKRQINLIESVLQAGKDEGFELTRLVANMEWALEDKAGVEDIVEYESRLNYVLPKYKDPVICTYQLVTVQRGGGHGHIAHASPRHPRWRSSRESALRSTG